MQEYLSCSRVKVNHSVAIACAAGGFKGAFIHGVLSAFEEAGIKADAYGAGSSSVIPSALAAIGQINHINLDYWLTGFKLLKQSDYGMSQMIKHGINHFHAKIVNQLFEPGKPRFFIATSAVITSEAATQTQSSQARRLGRCLLVDAIKKDRSWVEQHLQLALFDSANSSSEHHLGKNNFHEVAYASTRMLNAWDIPAWIEGLPYLDAAYTCLCPAIEMVKHGYQKVIAIATQPGILYRDMFQLEAIPAQYQGIPIDIIKPDIDPQELGVDITKATPEGLVNIYQHGKQKAIEFLEKLDTEGSQLHG